MNANGTAGSPAAKRTCSHWPPCPAPDAPDARAAHVISDHLEQGWELLCNGVVLFDDQGALLPDGRILRAAASVNSRQYRVTALAATA
jgi:uncharacterized protein DUF5999